MVWESNVLFPFYHTEEFEVSFQHLKNLTAVSIDNNNAAVATTKNMSHSENKTMQQYFQDLENIRLSENKAVTSTDNVFIIVLSLITIQSCYFMFKQYFMPSHNI